MAVVIIPGLLRTQGFYKPLGERIIKAGFKADIVDLGYNIKNLDASSEIVLQQLNSTKERNDVIAHSFGGIILKYLIYKHPQIKDSIKSIAFASVPHGGAWSALLLAMLPAARDILPFRKQMRDLAYIALPESTVNFISESELKIWPRRNALLKDRIDIVIPGTNHDSIIHSEIFAAKVIEFIKSNFEKFFLSG
jgi:pimeloyl-ACP methyl ester carboxylesterase